MTARNRLASAIAGRPRVVLAALLLIGLAVRLPTLGQPLLGRDGFRQTTTAYPALIYHEEGIDLLRTPLPVLGPPFDVPMEFPLFQALASIVMATGLDPDASLRLTSLAAFYVTAVLMWVLVRRTASTAAAHVAVAAFLFSPFALGWSRASTIEWLATAGAVGGVLLAAEWMERGHRVHGLLALLATTVGMLVKVTTGLYWLLPIVGLRLDRVRADSFGRGHTLALAGLIVGPLAAATLWTRYADGVKLRAPQTVDLTSVALIGWLFGTLEQRLDLANWTYIASRTVALVLGPFFALVLVGIIFGARSPRRWYWTGVALACGLPVATFFNLYLVHDYYVAAIAPGLAALIGVGAVAVWQGRPSAHGGLVAAAGLALVLTLQVVSSYWISMYDPLADPEDVLPQSREIAAASAEGELVLVLGRDWDPSVLYHARRRGLTLADRYVERAVREGWLDDGYTLASVARPEVDPIWLLRHWAVIAPVGSRTYALRDSASGLEALVIAFTDSAAVPGEARPLVAGQELRCGDDGLALPEASGGIWLLFAASSNDARIRISGTPAPLPLVPAVFVGERVSASGPVTLSCAGAPSIRLVGAYSGPRPH